jgi:hypothetical protein
MEYFRLNLYQQGKQKVQKGVLGLRPEVVAATPAAAMGIMLLLFFFMVYLPKRSTLEAQRRNIIVIEEQIQTMNLASRIIKPLEKQFLDLRKERIRLTPILQDVVQTIPGRVWMTGLEWKPEPVTGRGAPARGPFDFRQNNLTLRGRAFSNPGQSPFGLANQFVNALVAEERLGSSYTVELGRTIESRERRPQDRTTTIGAPDQLTPEFRTVLDFTIHCRVKEK